MANKVKYGLCNVHYAKITKYDTETQKYTYDTPKPLPGAVSLSLDAEGSSDPFYADNIVYFQTVTNAGYSGDFELAMIPNDFRVDILGDTKDETTGAIIENSDAVSSEFALMFQFEGDVSARRHVLWRCKADRPSLESQTKEDTTTPNTDTLALTIMARENDHNIKSFIDNDETGAETYKDWFTKVWEPQASEAV